MKSEKIKNRCVIAFSCGFDSIAILLDMLNGMWDMPLVECPELVLSHVISSNIPSTQFQLLSFAKIGYVLDNEGINPLRNTIQITTSSVCISDCNLLTGFLDDLNLSDKLQYNYRLATTFHPTGLSAISTHAMAAIACVDCSYDNIEIFYGFNAGDDLTLYQNDVRTAILAQSKILTLRSDTNVTVNYPLSSHTKSDVIQFIYELIMNASLSNKKSFQVLAQLILHHVTFCEYVYQGHKSDTSCIEREYDLNKDYGAFDIHRVCTSCKDVLVALHELYRNGKDDIVVYMVSILYTNHRLQNYVLGVIHHTL